MKKETSTKTRLMYSLSSLGIIIPAEAVAGVIAFYIVDIKNLPVAWQLFEADQRDVEEETGNK